MPGTLFIVGTPIGNLEDITLRALRILREVDVVAAEDTRRTGKLLAHYNIRKPMVSVREHNEAAGAARLTTRISAGENVAFVSDAGTPGISDPGARLVRAARDAGIQVIPIPGPSAVTAALSVSGLSADTFTFLGFPPPSGKARSEWFEQAAKETRVVVAFESPHRIARTLDEGRSAWLNKRILVFREITKLHESYVEWDNLSVDEPQRGEYTLVLSNPVSPAAQAPDETAICDYFYRMTELAGLERQDAASMLAERFQLTPAEVLKTVKKANILAKQQNRSDS